MAAKARGRGGRTERRILAREMDKLARRKEKLAELSPGGAPERPLDVESASLVDPMARSATCLHCEGPLHLDEHAAVPFEGEMLRVARAHCPSCGARRELWFRIAPRVLN